VKQRRPAAKEKEKEEERWESCVPRMKVMRNGSYFIWKPVREQTTWKTLVYVGG
jgi:hypothetical protein